jgi:hypothetical protein
MMSLGHANNLANTTAHNILHVCAHEEHGAANAQHTPYFAGGVRSSTNLVLPYSIRRRPQPNRGIVQGRALKMIAFRPFPVSTGRRALEPDVRIPLGPGPEEEIDRLQNVGQA